MIKYWFQISAGNPQVVLAEQEVIDCGMGDCDGGLLIKFILLTYLYFKLILDFKFKNQKILFYQVGNGQLMILL